MLKFLFHNRIRAMERRYNYDATYLHELTDISTAAMRRYLKAQMAGRWRGYTPRDAWFASGIAGALIEDCGPCVQIASDMAVEAGMSGEIIAALLSGKPTSAEAQLGFDFGRALLTASDKLDDLREDVERRWGKEGVVALAFMAMSSRNYPVLKRALGHAKTCQRVRVGNADVAVSPALKAA
jgi:hypothetical protein